MSQMRISIDNLYVERKSGLLEDPCNYSKEEGICFSSFLIKLAILQSRRYVTNPILKVYCLRDNSVGIFSFRDIEDPGNDYILRDLFYKNQEPSSLFYYLMTKKSIIRIASGNNTKERFLKFNKDNDFEKIDTSFLLPWDFLLYRASRIPSQMPPRHPATLRSRYSPAYRYLPFCRRVKASREKVEKVVNPPQTPVFKNSTRFSGACRLRAIPVT